MKKALIVGIDDYSQDLLRGCCNDARHVAKLLSHNEDELINFDCILLTSDQETVTRSRLMDAIQRLFEGNPQSTLLYFAGHGGWSPEGGGILPQDAKSSDDWIPMWQIHQKIAAAAPRETVIVLDCCYSGAFGSLPNAPDGLSQFREGMSLLAATRAQEKAEEVDGQGVFSALFCSALDGGAANLVGDVSIGSVYAYVDQALGAWHQRPTFKAYLSNLTPLRHCKPRVSRKILRRLTRYFEDPTGLLRLDPSFEATEEPRNEANEEIFEHLKRLRDVGLLVPVGAKDLYYAAMHNKSCRLTALGRYYWKLAKEGRI